MSSTKEVQKEWKRLERGSTGLEEQIASHLQNDSKLLMKLDILQNISVK